MPKELVEEDQRAFRGVTIKNPLHYVFVKLKRKELPTSVTRFFM